MDPHLTQDGVLFTEQDGIFIPSEIYITLSKIKTLGTGYITRPAWV